MPYSTAGKNEMLNALKGTNPTTPITHAALMKALTPLTSVTGVAATDLLTKTSHGLSNGELVILSSLSGGAGLRTAYPYFVVGSAGNDFQLSETSGGSAFNFTTDISSVSVTKLFEVSGGNPAYARKTISFGSPSLGSMAASSQPVFDCPAAAVVDYVAFYSAVTSGTLMGIDDVTQETFGAQGTYTLTSAVLDLNA